MNDNIASGPLVHQGSAVDGHSAQRLSSHVKRSAVGFYALASYATVALAWLFHRDIWEGIRGQLELPDAYALCSPDGNNIYTVDPKLPKVECIVVNGSLIADRGSLFEVKQRWAQSVPLGSKLLGVRYIKPGAIIIPGISDSHGHILEYGASAMIPLEAAGTISDAVAAIREFVIANPDVQSNHDTIIDGWGWDQTKWNDEMPTAAALEADPILRGRKIVLQSKDGHALWVSSAIIKSIGSLPEFMEDGLITRDRSGQAAGVFVDNAQELIVKPPLTDDDLYRRFMITVNEAHKYGLTSVHDAGLKPISVNFFQKQASKGNLPIRVYGMMYFDENDYWGHIKEKIIDQGRLTVRSVKMFADGALRTGGAALYEPYADNHHTMGLMRLSADILQDVVPRFVRDGWQVNIHAIGDRANSIVLDAFELALQGINVTACRPRLEHAQIITDTDIARLAKLGIIASIQPTHATDDMWYAEDRIGPERIKSLYAFRSIVDSGARITLGSDFPVEPLNPLLGFYAAITRLTPSGLSPHGDGGWFPNQRLTRQEALEGMTIAPAYASFSEATLGSIEVGKRADYVVFSQDIMSVPVDEILNTTVHATVIDGRPMFGQI